MPQVDCVTLAPDREPYQRVTHLGGLLPEPAERLAGQPSRWSLPIAEAIRAIKRGSERLYLVDRGRKLLLSVGTHGEVEYLRTELDGDGEPLSLLGLAGCAGLDARDKAKTEREIHDVMRGSGIRGLK